jgi:hypothetical protein
MIGRWMETGRHYRLLFTKGEHDNPDQRIAEDIRIATESAVTLICNPCTWTKLLLMCLDRTPVLPNPSLQRTGRKRPSAELAR